MVRDLLGNDDAALLALGDHLHIEVRRLLMVAGVPERFADRRLATFDERRGTSKGVAASGEMVDHLREGLILSGGPGTGKTHLAVAILAARLERHLSAYPAAWWMDDGDAKVHRRPPLEVRFLVVPTFLDMLRSAIRWSDREDPLPDLYDVDLLVLDDLGREKVTDWASERLYVLVNERYNRRRPTIVTTNYTPGELSDRGYDALVSRLVEGAGIVRIEAPDYRRQVGR